MAEISELSGITGSTLELFRAAGFETAESLIFSTVPDILAALDRANAGYEVAVRRPTETSIRAWQDSARNLLKRRGLPTAKPVPEENLRAAGIDVKVVPVANVVEDLPLAAPGRPRAEPPAARPVSMPMPLAAQAPEAGPTEPKPEAAPKEVPKVVRSQRAKVPPARKTTSPAPRAVPPPRKQIPPAGRHKPPAESNGGPTGRVAADQSPADPAKSLSREKVRDRSGETGPEAPPEWEDVIEIDPTARRFRQLEAVKKAKPQGQRRNRGMSHPDAARVRLAAFVTILAPAMCLVAAAVLIGALVMARVYGWEFHWSIVWILLVFPFSLLLYLGVSAKARCRLCGQRLFVPRHCLKHERAKRSLFGHTYAVARDATLFGSYRCMLCGTKTRLKD